MTSKTTDGTLVLTTCQQCIYFAVWYYRQHYRLTCISYQSHGRCAFTFLLEVFISAKPVLYIMLTVQWFSSKMILECYLPMFQSGQSGQSGSQRHGNYCKEKKKCEHINVETQISKQTPQIEQTLKVSSNGSYLYLIKIIKINDVSIDWNMQWPTYSHYRNQCSYETVVTNPFNREFPITICT